LTTSSRKNGCPFADAAGAGVTKPEGRVPASKNGQPFNATASRIPTPRVQNDRLNPEIIAEVPCRDEPLAIDDW
jgi:hypothetical protein